MRTTALPSADPARARRPILGVLALAVAAAWAQQAHANPAGAAVIAGQAAIVQQGKLTTVTNSNGAVIHWQSFSIGRDEITRFVQPSASSSVLNRVVGSDPSVILGQLQSNGRVFLVNPAGILVGAGARIDVGAFVASSLNLRNEDFLANRLTFEQTPGAGLVRNEGAITTPQGGQVYLVAPRVENAGAITAPRGDVALAAGRTVEIGDTAAPGVRIAVAGGETAANLGSVAAEAGRIGLFGALVKNSGSLNASSAVVEGGRILLKAKTEALVDGNAAIGATGSRGGRIEVTGERVAIADRAVLDASGANGGGTVLVGGDFQGGNPAVGNAAVTWVGGEASLRADATAQGDGGLVVAWADDTARVHGSLTARGAGAAGRGGLVETSGKRTLDVAGVRVDAGGRGGAGTWLLDPEELRVVNNGSPGTNSNVTGAPNFAPVSSATPAVVSSDTLQSAINAGTSVTLATGAGGAGTGDIIFDATGAPIVIAKSSNTFSSTLNVNAYRNVVFTGGATTFKTTAGAGTMQFSVNLAAGTGNPAPARVVTDAGATVNLDATTTAPVVVQINNGKTWNNNGTVNLQNYALLRVFDGSAYAVFRNAGTFNTSVTGNWFITGNPGTQLGTFDNFGVFNTTGGSIEAIFKNNPGSTLNMVGPNILSLQNAHLVAGAANLPAGSTLWISEFHGTQALFQGTAISGGGRVLTQGAVQANFEGVTAPGAQLHVNGGSVSVQNGTSLFNNLNFTAGSLKIDNGILATAADLTVPNGITYVGNVGLASGGILTVPTGLTITAPSVALAAGTGIDLNGGNVVASAGALNLATSGLVLVRNGGTATGRPTRIFANNLVVTGGTVTSVNNPLDIKVNNDLVMNPVSGTALLLSTGSGVNIDLAGPNSRLVLDGTGGGVAHVVSNAAGGATRINFGTRGEGGIVVDGVRGLGPGPSSAGFYGGGGQPAVLGSNLFVRYGGAVSDVCQTLPGLCVLRPTNILAAPRPPDPRQVQKDPDEGIGAFGDDAAKRRRPGVCKAA
ncbi:MAG: filamentous hemagglutinin N-terminal domain-containing protein [Burkholderiales bacterium]|nr:filamentous hemagglutinin N-terminal domain-containing protein [Burkholderiales bacterium]